MPDKQTVIGPNTRVLGEVRGDEDVLVHGRIDGRVQLSESLTIEPGAIVQADVQARAVVIAGVLVGNVTASEAVRLLEKARVVGDLTAPRVIIEAGAAYRGRVEMGEVDGTAAKATQAVRRPVERESASAVKAPPRMVTPARAVSATPAAPRIATAARVASAPARTVMPPPRPSAPPGPPRPEVASVGSAASPPAWAKKKVRRR
jgi:cytoskeletal protein CcmA (bactofilin family)